MSQPTVTKFSVYPVAGRDSMELNLSGAHAPVLHPQRRRPQGLRGPHGPRRGTRRGEDHPDPARRRVPRRRGEGGRLQARPARDPAAVRGPRRRAAAACRPSTCAPPSTPSPPSSRRSWTCSASTSTCRSRRCCGDGQQRDSVRVLGYLFYVGDPDRPTWTTSATDSDVDWYRIRHEEALTPEAIVRQAEATHEPVRLPRLQAQGRCPGGRRGGQGGTRAQGALPRRPDHPRPERRLVAARGGRAVPALVGTLAYAEDPCGAEGGYSGREILAEFRRATGLPTATNMIATDWRQLTHALALQSRRHPAGRPALLDHAGLGPGGPALQRDGPDLGLPLQQPLRHLAGHGHPLRRRRPGRVQRPGHPLDLAGRPGAAHHRPAADRRRRDRRPRRARPGRRARHGPAPRGARAVPGEGPRGRATTPSGCST